MPPPDDSPIPNGPDPIPLDPKDRILWSDCGFADGRNRVVPPVTLRHGRLLTMVMLPILSLARLAPRRRAWDYHRR
jgi:hypothetical protein